VGLNQSYFEKSVWVSPLGLLLSVTQQVRQLGQLYGSTHPNPPPPTPTPLSLTLTDLESQKM